MGASRAASGLLATAERISCADGDDEETRARKAGFTLTVFVILPAGTIWGLLYLTFGAPLAGAVPLSYVVLSTVNLVVLRRTRRFRSFQVSELVLMIALPFALQLLLGGFVPGSAVVVWGFIGPLIAVLFTSPREATAWFAAYVGTVVVAGVVQPSLDVDHDLPSWLVRAFFVMNVGAMSAIAFATMVTFGQARNRLRALELAYLEQEVLLRQQEKLATLGTLAAGVAHELNNPAAAVQRAAEQLRPTLSEVTRGAVALSPHASLADRFAVEVAARRAPPPPDRTPLQVAADEDAVEGWLADRGVERPWELAPTLVGLGCTVTELDALAADLDLANVGPAISFLAHTATAAGLTDGIAAAAHRISEIVAALRSYAYLDRGTWQTVDVTEGIESTLVLLQDRLRGMRIERRYGSDVPRIEVRGNELNQVWTNIIDNAVDATGGTGTLVVRTSAEDGHVVVELEDDGPGMPDDVARQVFDPFFTTKPPGRGTGLGLNISHTIVVRQHAGRISVSSEPGRTCFRVELPRRRPPATASPAA